MPRWPSSGSTMSKGKVAAGLSAAAILIAAPFVARFEGLELTPYKDIAPGGPITVCYGETVGVENRRYTPTECRLMLQRSLASHGADIARCMPAGLPDHVQAAILSFGYNVGAASFCGSSMARKLKAGDVPGACAELSRWVYVAGKDCRAPSSNCGGIVKRRAEERAMCEGPQ